nr:hypothetical protein [Cupriavidus necator]
MSRDLVDSHLVRVLYTLLTERSVSLRRLRALTGDPLLVAP